MLWQGVVALSENDFLSVFRSCIHCEKVTTILLVSFFFYIRSFSSVQCSCLFPRLIMVPSVPTDESPFSSGDPCQSASYTKPSLPLLLLSLCRSRQWLTSLLPRHCPTFRSDRSPPWQRWLAHVQSLSVQPWWRGRSRTRAMFNEPGSQGQNKDSIDNSKCWDFGDPGQVLLCQWFYRFNKTCDAIC